VTCVRSPNTPVWTALYKTLSMFAVTLTSCCFYCVIIFSVAFVCQVWSIVKKEEGDNSIQKGGETWFQKE
jgi:hypothetical protein